MFLQLFSAHNINISDGSASQTIPISQSRVYVIK